ncbi:glycosyltransferase [Clostridium frigoris]|uniref:Glycosyltransferase n=2 Tax=Clostridium frigoris TaxID=205327 RepID=A0ABS6BU11_9CLOT|nr:glycosyltransferase [Clostridium frigoris]
MKSVISIIVPVYKVEKYLDRCVQSLINQTCKNIEIILVDDGSTDNCPDICDGYVERDTRIKVIHKTNGGLSDARNAGIREATGEYILFVDSDDYINLDTCEQFVLTIDDNVPDIVVGNAKSIENKNTSNIQHNFIASRKVVTGKQYLKAELKSRTMYMMAWLNMYNRVFILNNNLEFKVGLLHEDEEFTPRAFLKAEKIISTDIVFYNYVIREDSITTTKNKAKNAEHLMRTCKELELIYNEIEDAELRRLLMDSLVNKFLSIFQAAGLHRKEYSYLVDKSFLRGKEYTIRNKLRVALFIFNKKIYYYVNKFGKYLKR